MGLTSRRYSIYKIAGRKVTNELKRPGVAQDGQAPIWDNALKKYKPGAAGGGSSTTTFKFQTINYNALNTGLFTVSNGIINDLFLVEVNGDIQREGVDFNLIGQDIDFGVALPGTGTLQVFYFETLSVVKPDYTNDYKTVPTIAYTLLQSDLGKTLLFTNVNPITITVPAGLTDGFQCIVRKRNGSGVITYQNDGISSIESEGLTQSFNNTSVLVEHFSGDIYGLSGKLL